MVVHYSFDRYLLSAKQWSYNGKALVVPTVVEFTFQKDDMYNR